MHGHGLQNSSLSLSLAVPFCYRPFCHIPFALPTVVCLAHQHEFFWAIVFLLLDWDWYESAGVPSHCRENVNGRQRERSLWKQQGDGMGEVIMTIQLVLTGYSGNMWGLHEILGDFGHGTPRPLGTFGKHFLQFILRLGDQILWVEMRTTEKKSTWEPRKKPEHTSFQQFLLVTHTNLIPLLNASL